jgi:hypothetical protein
MNRSTIKDYIYQLPLEILEAVYNIELFTNSKTFKAQMSYNQEIFEKYEDKICHFADNDDCRRDFIDFKIGSWYVVMETKEEKA